MKSRRVQKDEDEESIEMWNQIEHLPLRSQEDVNVEIIPLRKFAASTSTLVIEYAGEIDVCKVFYLLPIHVLGVPSSIRRKKKYIIPDCKTPGAIVALKYKLMARGFIKNFKASFDNVVSIDLYVENKYINIKLSPKTVQMTGVKSLKIGKKAIVMLFQAIYLVQELLNKIRSSNSQFTIKWLKNHVRGKEHTYERTFKFGPKKNVTSIRWTEEDYLTIQDQEKILKLAEKEESIDYSLVEKLLIYLPENKIHKDFCKLLDRLKETTFLIDEGISIDYINQVMVNINYYLGFPISRVKLAERIVNYEGYSRYFDFMIGKYMKIERVYNPLNTDLSRIKSIPRHTFSVSDTGCITQSGPGIKKMEKAYEEFVKIIYLLRKDIIGHPITYPKKKPPPMCCYKIL